MLNYSEEEGAVTTFCHTTSQIPLLGETRRHHTSPSFPVYHVRDPCSKVPLPTNHVQAFLQDFLILHDLVWGFFFLQDCLHKNPVKVKKF